jgi:Site-specific recombinase XerD
LILQGFFRFVFIILYGHSYAVAALQAGGDIKTVQESLGHHTAAFTLDVYGHVTSQMKQQSAKRMEQFILSVQNL